MQVFVKKNEKLYVFLMMEVTTFLSYDVREYNRSTVIYDQHALGSYQGSRILEGEEKYALLEKDSTMT